MNGSDLVALLDRALPVLAEHREELRDLDAALGDGDLGITVSKGAEAVQAKVGALESPTPAAVLRAAAMAFSSANPSTFAALVGGALLAGAKGVGDADELGVEQARTLAHAVMDSIAAKGKSAVGDKTVLDALAPSVEVLDASSGSGADTLAAMVERAREGVESTASLQSRKGRASWVGERSVGHADPGATAYLRFLEALAQTWEGSSVG